MMRLLGAVAVALSLVSCAQEPPPYESRYVEPVGSKPIAVAVLGDSFTTGTDYGGVGSSGWPNLATLALRERGINVAMARGAQKGAGWVTPNSEGFVFSREAIRNVSAATSLVVLFGSLNDGAAPLDELTVGVADTLSNIKRTAPNAELLVIGPPTLGRGTPDEPGRIPAIRDAIKAQAEAAGAAFVDPITENWFNNPELIGADGIHPTDAGHEMMAAKIAPLIAAQVAGGIHRP